VSTAVASTDGANFSSHDQPDWRGRRRGRRLTAYRRGLLTGLLPNLRVPCSPEGASIDPAVLFASAPRAVWLEVGFGSGEHLAEQARRHPEIGFIGCEVFVNGIAALLDHIERLEITNVRIFDDDARLLLRSLPEACIDRMFLLFPDPWQKARHAKRRFIGPLSLPILAHLLADHAELRIASDDAGYIRWTLRYVLERPEFAWLAAGPRDWRQPPADWVETRYHHKAASARRQSAFLCFRRRPRRGP
jgi:tRNA (guanine-N7-)-methyltransferase